MAKNKKKKDFEYLKPLVRKILRDGLQICMD